MISNKRVPQPGVKRGEQKEELVSTARKPVTIQHFWRIVYWVSILCICAAICFALFYTLKSDFGQCSDYDVKCE
ncbi:uncharacterized protein Dwil_GK15587 [Drosophila willistoni]|uniref:Uncharacterized protein n=1 Tax=Drosophila willistoni TaxID=7260 RepID=B4MX42_DROWI|nr:uncharacterized protein LOC6642091 [Drosophila willistoni]EDW76681.1 uncharacterized protein Dwil_GK15587 [Drosophila willistoni]